MRDWKNQVDYEMLIHKTITVLTWKYWYFPFIKEEIAKIISTTWPNKQHAHEKVKHWIKNDLQKILINEIPTIYDEVDCMFQFLAKKLQYKTFAYTEIDMVKSEFSNLRTMRTAIKNPSSKRALGIKNLIVKFYSSRYVPLLCN